MRYEAPHPLADVPPVVLAAARAVMAGGVLTRDVDPEMADPLADAVVAAVAPFARGWYQTPPAGVQLKP
jgi:hypothetical protein